MKICFRLLLLLFLINQNDGRVIKRKIILFQLIDEKKQQQNTEANTQRKPSLMLLIAGIQNRKGIHCYWEQKFNVLFKNVCLKFST